MLRKSPASIVWAAILQNADFFYSALKVKKLSKSSIFSYLKFFSVFIVNGSTILFSKHGKIRDKVHYNYYKADVRCEDGHTC